MDKISYTASTMDSIPNTLNTLRTHFNTGITKPLAYRQRQLAGLKRFLKECTEEIEDALYEDLKKPSLETRLTEIDFLLTELRLAQKKLASWMKTKRVSTPIMAQPGQSYIYPEPYGVALIIGPWNFPLQLLLGPLIGAIAAGNCVILKPSEISAKTSELLAEKLPHYIDSDTIQVIHGGVPETTALLAEKFDYIFYTGNSNVGKIIMQAAAKHLTPVCLELGGKSPCIVDKNTNIPAAAQRIVWGKFLNAGQMCVAPDYVLVDASIEEELIKEMKKSISQYWGPDPKASPHYGRIINENHYRRLRNLLVAHGEIAAGGEVDDTSCYIAPTILRQLPNDALIMNDEIFGPLLPIIPFHHMEEAITYINEHPKPLALYLFTNEEKVKKQIMEQTSSGSICINHVILQLTVPGLPFGGVGASGMGAYHGKASFDTFTHYKSIFKKPISFDFLQPYLAFQKMLWKLRKK